MRRSDLYLDLDRSCPPQAYHLNPSARQLWPALPISEPEPEPDPEHEEPPKRALHERLANE